jgi:NAD(P)-dependent dehydrogenase (short-subunit alcohol dehydrogenase family)
MVEDANPGEKQMTESKSQTSSSATDGPKGPLRKQVALVTGGSRGIGFAIARKLGTLGARVAICGRRKETLAAAADHLRKENIEALPIPADLTKEADIQSLVERAQRDLGPIDILINNAGVGAFGSALALTEADWDRVLDTNLKAVFLLCRGVGAEMKRRRSGYIINISSLAGKNAIAGGAIYCASKWGLQGLTYCLAEELRGDGIRVSVICPGSVATEFSPHTGKDTTKLLQPDDVAHAVETLLTQSPQSFISEVLLRPTQKP